MTTPPGLLDLPADEQKPWFLYGQSLHVSFIALWQQVQGIAPVSGFIATINGDPPGPTGDISLGAADVGALSSSYTPGFNDLPIGVDVTVRKDTVTGFWPSGYNGDGSPVYTGGSTTAGVRPHARQSTVRWLGADPSPGVVSSGTGGMLAGFDERAIPGP